MITLLANNSEAMALSDFHNQGELSHSDLLNAMQSLARNFLVEIQEENNLTKYSLNCVLKEYIKSQNF